MKNIYEGEYEGYSDKANDIENRLRPIIDQMLNELWDEGYSLRQASHLMQELISITAVEKIIRRNTKRRTAPSIKKNEHFYVPGELES
jgi:hypothetical protein